MERPKKRAKSSSLIQETKETLSQLSHCIHDIKATLNPSNKTNGTHTTESNGRNMDHISVDDVQWISNELRTILRELEGVREIEADHDRVVHMQVDSNHRVLDILFSSIPSF